jgi:DNA-binding transcriptional ArsR family regulator
MKHANPYAALERLFHEPARLAITSALCDAEDGCSFNDLKAVCNLTDGNLNRHLKVLLESGVVESHRQATPSRPVTMVRLTEAGRLQFLDYLHALEEVLHKAAEALETRDPRHAAALGTPHFAKS